MENSKENVKIVLNGKEEVLEQSHIDTIITSIFGEKITPNTLSELKTKLKNYDEKHLNDIEKLQLKETELLTKLGNTTNLLEIANTELETTKNKIPDNFTLDKWNEYQTKELTELRNNKLNTIKAQFLEKNKLPKDYTFHPLVESHSAIVDGFKNLSLEDVEFEKKSLELYNKIFTLEKESGLKNKDNPNIFNPDSGKNPKTTDESVNIQSLSLRQRIAKIQKTA